MGTYSAGGKSYNGCVLFGPADPGRPGGGLSGERARVGRREMLGRGQFGRIAKSSV
jgi:hypothetical protein